MLGIDILPYNSVARYIPAQHWSRFTYIQADVSSTSRLDLVNIVHNAWNITLDRIDHFHGSPPCKTYSEVHHSKKIHRSGLIPLANGPKVQGKKLYSTKLVLNKKPPVNGEPEQYKARLCVHNFKMISARMYLHRYHVSRPSACSLQLLLRRILKCATSTFAKLLERLCSRTPSPSTCPSARSKMIHHRRRVKSSLCLLRCMD